MNVSWGYWIGLAAGSGLTAGIANQLFSMVRERTQRTFQRDQYTREIEHQRLILLDQRSHDARVRAEQAHFDARPLLLPHASNVHAWLFHEWAAKYGQRYAYTSKASSQVLLKGPDEALTELAKIAITHPTRYARDLARRLDSKIETHYNVTATDGNPDPPQEELEAWISAASDLIEAIHDFPVDPAEPGAA
jgi:hypothetical protein